MPSKKNGKKRPAKQGKVKKKKPVNTKRKRNSGSSFLQSLLWLSIIAIIVTTTFITVHYLFPPEKESEKEESFTEFEVYPEETYHPPPLKEDKPKDPKRLPLVAIIIDDIGYNRNVAKKFASLDPSLTFSILPNSPHKRAIAEYAYQKGLEIMLHLPMEPMGYPRVNPGHGALLVSMSPDELTERLKKNIASIPHVEGVNNHMGSRMTTLSSIMYQIFVVLKKENLFFIDSRTTPNTLCKPSARLLKIPFAQRDVFLDHMHTKKAIQRQLRLLLRHATRYGTAIGIGHPHKTTYEVFKEELPKLKNKIEIVHASRLVKILGEAHGQNNNM